MTDTERTRDGLKDLIGYFETTEKLVTSEPARKEAGERISLLKSLENHLEVYEITETNLDGYATRPECGHGLKRTTQPHFCGNCGKPVRWYSPPGDSGGFNPYFEITLRRKEKKNDGRKKTIQDLQRA